MKKNYWMVLAVFFLLLNINISNAAALKLMPIGDSITRGAVGAPTYRCFLWGMLAKSNLPQFDFVGSMNTKVNQTEPGISGCPYQDFDVDHEGHEGWTTDRILKQIGGWASNHTPDVALIHLGTNDLSGGQNAEGIIGEMDKIVDYLRTAKTGVVIFIAGVIPDTVHANIDDKTREYNSRLSTFCKEKSTAESPIIFVDLYSKMDPSKDLFDGLHPTDSGNKKMANGWFQALKAYYSKKK